MAMYAPPLKVSVTNHLGVGPLKSEAQGDNEVAFGVGKVPWVEVVGRLYTSYAPLCIYLARSFG